MANRRFTGREITNGSFSGAIHVAGERYIRFLGELNYFSDYLNRRLLPREPEEATMLLVLTNLENILESECEALIHSRATHSGKVRERAFNEQIANGFVAFKTKFEWLRSRDLISREERDVMEEIHVLRNGFVHARGTKGRRRYKYRGGALLTRAAIHRMFVDVELALRTMRKQSGRTCDWATVPPGYASEMKWPAKYISALKG